MSETTGDGSPFDLLRAWLPANADPLRPPMTLATVDADGAPEARIVLLSEFDEHGLSFHTEVRSRKVAQLAADPRACLTLLLDDPVRQIVVKGVTVPLDEEALGRVYRARSRYLQVLAWVNTAELAREPADVRHAVWQAFEERHPVDLDPPASWAGYLLRPERITFWFSDAVGPSTRQEFQRTGETWTSESLPG